MADKVCGDAYNEIFKDFLTGATPPALYLRLYSNNYTPTLADVPSDYTESVAAGYAAIALSGGSWTITDTSGVLVCTYPSQTFTLTGSGTIYGYYVTDSGKTKVYWAGLAAGGPFSFSSSGGVLLVSLALDGPTS
jgi:hypothetical protein